MIYLVLFFEFFLIGLFAVGGGAATIPFLFDLSSKYDWFSVQELINMIAISESTPGPIGVNMATYAGFKAASYFGGLTATLGLITPSIFIIILVAKALKRYACNKNFNHILQSLQPAVIALILNAAFQIAAVSLSTFLSCFVFIFMLVLMRFYRASPIFYMILAGVIGFTLKI